MQAAVPLNYSCPARFCSGVGLRPEGMFVFSAAGDALLERGSCQRREPPPTSLAAPPSLGKQHGRPYSVALL